MFAPSPAEMYPAGEPRACGTASPSRCAARFGRTLRGGRHRGGQALRAHRPLHRRLRPQGLPAAQGGRADGERSALRRRGRRHPDGARGRRSRDELAQRLPLSPDRARALSIPAALAGASGLRARRTAAAAFCAIWRSARSRRTRRGSTTSPSPIRRRSSRSTTAHLNGPALVALAVWIGTTRLIDNVVLGEDPPPKVLGVTSRKERAHDRRGVHRRRRNRRRREHHDRRAARRLFASAGSGAPHVRAERGTDRRADPSDLAHRVVVPDTTGQRRRDGRRWRCFSPRIASTTSRRR